MASPAAKLRKIDPNATQINEGYDIELFLDSKDANRYICVICQCVFKKPHNIGCKDQHVFCKGCLDNYFIPTNLPKSCPSCRAQGLLKSNIKSCLYLQRLVNSLKVKCELQLEQNENDYQCVWNGELSDLNEHINIRCPLTNVSCNHCNQNMKRYQLTEHENICAERPVPCNQCGQEIKRTLMDRHLDNKCPMKMLSCDECNENVLRKEMDNHLLLFCPQHEIMCSFQPYGCDVRIKRNLMDNHLKEKELEHLRMKVNIIENELKKVKQLFKEKDNINMEMRNELVALKKENNELLMRQNRNERGQQNQSQNSVQNAPQAAYQHPLVSQIVDQLTTEERNKLRSMPRDEQQKWFQSQIQQQNMRRQQQQQQQQQQSGHNALPPRAQIFNNLNHEDINKLQAAGYTIHQNNNRMGSYIVVPPQQQYI